MCDSGTVRRDLVVALQERDVPLPPPPLPPLIGRAGLLASARRAVDRLIGSGRPGRVLLQGRSGVGASAVAQQLCAELADEGALVLWGRARRDDRIAFHALLEAVDELRCALAPRRREVARAAGVVRHMFPVLGELGDAPRPAGRRGAFDAFLEILAAAARNDGRLVLVVDGVEHADKDSLALIDHVLREGAPGLVVLAVRSVDGDGPGAAWARRAEQVLPVQPLAPALLRTIAERAANGEAARSDLLAAAFTAGGRPHVAELAGRRLSRGLAPCTDPLRAEAQEVAEQDGRLAALLVAADHPMGLGSLAAAADLDPEDARQRVHRLAERGVLHAAGAIGFRHEALRQVVATVLPPASLAEAHRVLAERILAGVEPAPRERLVRHLRAGGRPMEAARHAVVAAETAERRFAFELAAELTAMASRHGDVAEAGTHARASARRLERAGEMGRAAQAWRAVSGDPNAPANVARALAGDSRLAEVAEVLHDVPGAGQRDVAGLRFLAGPIRRRLPHLDPMRDEVSEVRLALVALGLDPQAGVRRLVRLRSRLTNPDAAAFCDYLLAHVAQLSSSRPGASALAMRYRRAAERALLGRGRSRPEVQTIEAFVGAFDTIRGGGFERGRGLLARIEQRLASADDASLEVRLLLAYIAQLDLVLQRPSEIERTLARLDRTARGTLLRSFAADAAAGAARLRGDLEQARACIDDALGEIPDAASMQAADLLLARPLCDVLSDPSAGRQAFLEALRVARPHRLLRTLRAGPLAASGALLEACALRAGDRGASAGVASHFAALAESAVPFAAGMALRALAYVADHEGRPVAAVTLLRHAEHEARRRARTVDACIASYQLGRRLGASEGERRRSEAARMLRALGVDRMHLDEDPGPV